MKSVYTLAMSHRLRPLVFSFLFLLVSLGTYQVGSHYLASQDTLLDSPAGVWRQYVVADEEIVYLATFSFQEERGDYAVQALDVGPCTFPQSGFRTFSHRFDGQRWSFHSDWHQYGVAEFQLERVGQDRFEGYAYLDGSPRPYRHILVRVSD